GGPNLAKATCQVLPPNISGYRPYCPYTAGSTKRGEWTGPDLAKAKALVARSGTRGMKVTFWALPGAPVNRAAVKALHALGYRVVVKKIRDFERYYTLVSDSRQRAQIGFAGWYAFPASFLIQLFSCPAFLPQEPSNLNVTQFCDPGIDRRMRSAQ